MTRRNAPQKANEIGFTDVAVLQDGPNPGVASEPTGDIAARDARVANIEHWSRAAFSRFKSIDAKDLVHALGYRFDIEHISKYFITTEFEYDGRELSISPSNSFLIDFPIPRESQPANVPENGEAASDRYRLLLLFGLHDRPSFSPALTRELDLVFQDNNLNRIVVWTTQHHEPDEVEALKSNHIFIVKILWKEAEATSSISRYIPLQNSDYDYTLTVNLAADLVLRRLKKMFHIILSEVAAPAYDETYAAKQPGTREAMNFEERLVNAAIQKYLPPDRRQIAIDAGCGTGRHAFLLRRDFDRVYGFDFSHAMIERARQKRATRDLRNMIFRACDFEYETLAEEQYFRGQTDLIVASFGFGSFIEDTLHMVETFYSWLRDDGILLLSCYNPQTILSEITPNWRDTSLAAHLDSETTTLRVQLTPKLIFHIYCKPYGNEIESKLKTRFKIREHRTFPTLMALMPNSLLQMPKALELFRHVDEQLAVSQEYRYGHYVTLVCQKTSETVEA